MTIKMHRVDFLKQLHKDLTNEYISYNAGEMTQDEYLVKIKPIDQAIDDFEMATLQDTLALRGSSSLLSQKPES